MRVGGWRVAAWGGRRTDLLVGLGAVVLAGSAPTALVSQTVTPATGTVTLTAWAPSRGDQPAVRWSGLTSLRWTRRWGPHPDQGASRHDRNVPAGALALTGWSPSLGRAPLPCGALALTGDAPGVTVGLGVGVAAGPKLVWRCGLNSYIGKLVWGPTGGGVNDIGKQSAPGTLRLTGAAPSALVDDSANDRTARVSWVQLSVPDADRKARVSYVALSTPDAPTRARVSWVQLSVPDAPRSARVSYVALSVPDAPVSTERRALVSWVQFRVPLRIDLTAPPSPTRTWTVPRETRTYVVPRESRSWKGR